MVAAPAKHVVCGLVGGAQEIGYTQPCGSR
ncbi:Uncharacterised protein [Mycobacterium tuberculosis]|uniref:Uncharacterized protein n=1 Tax=Mycobacterium tuberculosis TaxID=1773 RepID=A0A916P9S3_MYCTX|nr:Uncharacterised protein [Mycobacterium tuberculosis]COZ35535.1 Uncharacterised protein [Mycobacterium tuberculosis]CPA54260.1 Uncharacterised protein [Mycobacterium tuberculosis]